MVIDGSGILFLAIVCLGVPYLAWKSSRRFGSGPLPISMRRFFIQSIFWQFYLVGLALVAAWHNRIDLLVPPPAPLRAWGLAALFLALLLGVMRWRWPHRGQESKDKLYRLLPHKRGDFPLYFALCLAAGVCEEAVYRGVTATLLARLTGSVAAAVVIASVVFALAHVVQGRRATIAVFFIALGAHALYLVGQSLFPVMAMHAIYDALAGLLMSRWYERELESAPQPVLSQTTPMR
jgi:membrane protease YdiL (CAAX protease family)